MKGILAIETATDACSLALWRNGEITECHEILPRQHSQRLFGMLNELIPGRNLPAAGVEGIAWGCGPGSFTGLRVAASAVQGLCYTAGIPAIPVSTLACQVQTAIREGRVAEGDRVVSLLDARINEVYAATYQVLDGRAVELSSARACAPGVLVLDDDAGSLVAIGNGSKLRDQFTGPVLERISRFEEAILPHARDLIPLALAAARAGNVRSPGEVQPVYVRDKINWKKIAEQGKRS